MTTWASEACRGPGNKVSKDRKDRKNCPGVDPPRRQGESGPEETGEARGDATRQTDTFLKVKSETPEAIWDLLQEADQQAVR